MNQTCLNDHYMQGGVLQTLEESSIDDSTGSELDARKLAIMKKIARLDIKKLTATSPEENAQLDSERARLKSQKMTVLHTSYRYHTRMWRYKVNAYKKMYKTLESESLVTSKELKIISKLSSKIQDAIQRDLPETAQASSELQALFHQSALHDHWDNISQLNNEINVHNLKACEDEDEEDDKTVSSEVRLMVEDEDEESKHNMVPVPKSNVDDGENNYPLLALTDIA